MSIHLQEEDEEDFDDCKSSSSESAAIDVIKNYKIPLPAINLQRIQAVTGGPRFTMPEIDVSIGVHRVIIAHHLPSIPLLFIRVNKRLTCDNFCDI